MEKFLTVTGLNFYIKKNEKNNNIQTEQIKREPIKQNIKTSASNIKTKIKRVDNWEEFYNYLKERHEKKKKAEKGVLDELIEECKKAFASGTDDIKTNVGNVMKTLGYQSFAVLSEKQNKSDVIELANSLNIPIPEELKETNKGKK